MERSPLSQKLVRAWERFWFESGDPEAVLPVRFCVYGLASLFLFFVRDKQPPGFSAHWQPISFYQLFSGPFSSVTIEILRITVLVAGILAALNIRFMWTASISFIAAVLVFGHSYNFGIVYHSTHMYVMSLGLLLFTRKGSTLGLQLMKVYVVYILFLCGLQKLYYGSGLEWAFSDSFYIRLFINPMQTPFAVWMMDQPLIVSQLFAAYALLAVEVSAPLALLGKRGGIVYFFIWSSVHVGVRLSLGIHHLFFSQILCYAAFLPWADLLSWWRAKRVSAAVRA